MKSLFITLLIIGSIITAYDYFGNPPGKKFIFKHLNNVPEEPAAPAPQAPVATAPAAPAAPVPAAPAAPAVAATPAPAAPMPAAPVEPAKPAAEANGFVPPTFEPVETLTANWSKIPASAFPRAVKLAKPTLFKMSVGGSQMPAGAAVQALSFSAGMITLAPAQGSSARAVVPLDDTDLKAILSAAYENWKPMRLTQLRQAYERRLAAAKAPPPAAVSAAGASDAVDGAGKPVRGTGGNYPLLVASMKAGEVTEITEESILFWGEATPTTIEGRSAWTIPLRFNANTVFGKMEAEVQAVVQNGRVKGWYYTGSGEQVP